MIDTDKYEGHAKEGWHFDSAHVLRDGYDKEITELVGEDWLDDKATQALIADAPLLLAEVMRLRGVIAQVWDLMQNSNHQDREAYFWGFDGKNTGWMKVHEELAMRELNWGEEE